MRIGWAVVAAGALVAVACTESNTPAGPLGPLAEIVDGSIGGGNTSFFWLPPLVLGPVQAGTNVTGLAPEVKIFQCTGGDCGDLSTEPVADFTTDTGPGSETVRDDGDHYIVNWHTNDAVTGTSVASGTYRICVGLQGNNGDMTLGHADVLVGDNGKAVKNARTDDSVPLVNQSTLPINFRIEAGYEDGGSDGGCGGGGIPT